MIRLDVGADRGDPDAEMGSRGGRPRIAQTACGNWNGYRGRAKVILFTNSPYYSQEEEARLWLDRALKLYTEETLNAVK